jgi:tetratricopeptide (TPR) repeat protein
MFYAGRAKESSLHEAEQAVARAIQIDANLSEAWASVGNIAQMRGQPERAEQMLSRAVELNPNNATAYHWLSIALMRLGRNDEALSAAESALVLDPLSAVINLGVGNSRRTVGRLDDAISAYQQAAAIEPTMALAYSNVGDTYWTWLGRFDKAGPWYEKAASLDPKNPDLLANVADTYLQLGEIPEAERWIARALAVSPNAAYPRFLAAQVSMHRGDLESARAHAKEAAEGNPLVLYLLRDDDLRRRDYASARARYAKAFPQLLAKELPTLSGVEALAAVDFARVLQHTGEMDRAMMLLDVTEAYFRKIPTMGLGGRFGIADAAIQALRGNTSTAVADLRKAEQAGWRSGWRYERDFDLNLESLRNEPEFKAVFADIELDIEKQRAAFAARPSELPLDFASFSK